MGVLTSAIHHLILARLNTWHYESVPYVAINKADRGRNWITTGKDLLRAKVMLTCNCAQNTITTNAKC